MEIGRETATLSGASGFPPHESRLKPRYDLVNPNPN